MYWSTGSDQEEQAEVEEDKVVRHAMAGRVLQPLLERGQTAQVGDSVGQVVVVEHQVAQALNSLYYHCEKTPLKQQSSHTTHPKSIKNILV